jgi:hypothetical protein
MLPLSPAHNIADPHAHLQLLHTQQHPRADDAAALAGHNIAAPYSHQQGGRRLISQGPAWPGRWFRAGDRRRLPANPIQLGF